MLPVDYGAAADPHDDPGEPVTEAVWLEPYPDEWLGPGSGLASPEARYEQRESVELAFIAALQHLPARQRAVLILRDVLDGALRQIAQRYVTAWERNDVGAVVAMLAEDAKLAMPPLPAWYLGRERVGIFLGAGPMSGATRWRLIPARANAQLAFGLYAWDDETRAFMPRAVDVLTLRGRQIQEITAFLTPDALGGFGLPASLPESGTGS